MSETDAPVRVRKSDGIGTITLNRPQSLNAMDIEVAAGFRDAVHALAGDTTLRAIVLNAEGRAFMAGGDLGYFNKADDPSQAARDLIEIVHDGVMTLAGAPQITIASVKGAAAGGGMSLALGLDLAIAADDAVFSFAYGQIGTTPDCGGSWTLPRLVGMRRSMEIALFGERIDAAEALRLGLVNRVVPRDLLDAETDKLARTIADGAPIAQRNIKRLLRASSEMTFERQLDAEIDSFAECAGTADFKGAVSAFLQKKNHRFEGR